MWQFCPTALAPVRVASHRKKTSTHARQREHRVIIMINRLFRYVCVHVMCAMLVWMLVCVYMCTSVHACLHTKTNMLLYMTSSLAVCGVSPQISRGSVYVGVMHVSLLWSRRTRRHYDLIKKCQTPWIYCVGLGSGWRGCNFLETIVGQLAYLFEPRAKRISTLWTHNFFVRINALHRVYLVFVM